MGFKLEVKLKANDKDIHLDIIYPFSVPERLFKHGAFRTAKKNAKKIDKKIKMEYEPVKSKNDRN